MSHRTLLHGELTKSVIGGFFRVYDALGHGLPESYYVEALSLELVERGHRVERELPVPIRYKGRLLGTQRIDLVVDGVLVLEVKATAVPHPSAQRQLHNYLRATGHELGLVLHFGADAQFFRVLCRHLVRTPAEELPAQSGSATAHSPNGNSLNPDDPEHSEHPERGVSDR